ncbi:MAG: ATP-binding protein [Deltaproteobacteria bacterium]|nr:ATP-binding protein [Deltaproteobacteria bacterium]
MIQVVKRNLYQGLVAWKEKKASFPGGRKPLILEGARQVGKTYLLKAFGRRHFPTVHYLNFEQTGTLAHIFAPDLRPHRILKELEFHFGHPIDVHNDLLIFDEVQTVPQALTSLKYFCEELPELALCCAGSLLGLELHHGAFPVGKVEFLHLYPVAFEEFLQALGDQRSLDALHGFTLKEPIPPLVHDHLWYCLKNYFVVGGLPEVVEAFAKLQDSPFVAMEAVRKLQQDLLITYLADMAKHAGKQNSMHLERLLRHIPEQLAKTQDQSAKKFKFSGAIPGLQGYARLAGAIDWLHKAKLVMKIPIVNRAALPLSAYAKDNCFKLYLFDVGLLGALSGLTPKTLLDYAYGSYKGYFAENFVAQEFMASGVSHMYAWNERTAEVEFLRDIDGKIYPIEVKSGWVSQAKSLRVFAQKYHPPCQIILSGKNLQIDQRTNTHYYPLYLAGRLPLMEG